MEFLFRIRAIDLGNRYEIAGSSQFPFLFRFYVLLRQPYTDEEKKGCIEAWARNLTGPPHDYRSYLPNVARELNLSKKIDIPVRVLWGERDRALTIHNLDGLSTWALQVSINRFPDAPHWIAHEKPEEIMAELGSFFDRYYPSRMGLDASGHSSTQSFRCCIPDRVCRESSGGGLADNAVRAQAVHHKAYRNKRVMSAREPCCLGASRFLEVCTLCFLCRSKNLCHLKGDQTTSGVVDRMDDCQSLIFAGFPGKVIAGDDKLLYDIS